MRGRSCARDAHGAEIVYEHARDGESGGWPFRYRAWQSYRLDADACR